MFQNIKHRQYEQRIVAGSIDEVYALRIAKSEYWQCTLNNIAKVCSTRCMINRSFHLSVFTSPFSVFRACAYIIIR